MVDHREALGRRVREVWIAWAGRQENPKPSWLVPWEELDDATKEADRCLGSALWGDGFNDGLEQGLRIMSALDVSEMSTQERDRQIERIWGAAAGTVAIIAEAGGFGGEGSDA